MRRLKNFAAPQSDGQERFEESAMSAKAAGAKVASKTKVLLLNY